MNMNDADGASGTWLGGSGVPGCAARLEVLYQIRDEDADDPDEDEALTTAWNDAEWDVIKALIAARPRDLAEFDIKHGWAMRLLAARRGDDDLYIPEPLVPLVMALVRDARALAGDIG
jgi:hypothetical protein